MENYKQLYIKQYTRPTEYKYKAISYNYKDKIPNSNRRGVIVK